LTLTEQPALRPAPAGFVGTVSQYNFHLGEMVANGIEQTAEKVGLAEATGGHGIGSPCKPPSRVQRVRSAIRDDGAAADGIGAKADQGEHSSTPIWRENRLVRSGLWPKPGMA